MYTLNAIVNWLYQIYQIILADLFSPRPPRRGEVSPKAPRIAVVGAGLTGVSSAAHAIAHGFNVTIFEAGGKDHLGGIWSRVNNTSSLQIYSIMYRFHPSVRFTGRYPDRAQIVQQITALWERYDLVNRTMFNTKVDRVYKDNKSGKWIVNDSKFGLFDGIIAAVGTCGEPKLINIEGQDSFKGEILHSSKLTGMDVKQKTVLVVGGGASAVEAVEYAVNSGAKLTCVLARTQKWMIPRNPIFDALIAMNATGEEGAFEHLPEMFLKRFFYRDLSDLAPKDVGLFTETPICNDQILKQLRSGQAQWITCDIKHFQKDGIVVNRRGHGTPKGGPGHEQFIRGDCVVLATGFHRPSLSFLPQDAFEPPYLPPNWYFQTFPVGHPDICATNSTFVSAIGTVGNFHIGIYTRYLLMFIADPTTRPTTAWQRTWVDSMSVLRRTAPGQGLNFFTFGELLLWFVIGVVLVPARWKWMFFIMFGWGHVSF